MAVMGGGDMGGGKLSWMWQDPDADCHSEGACLGDTEK